MNKNLSIISFRALVAAFALLACTAYADESAEATPSEESSKSTSWFSILFGGKSDDAEAEVKADELADKTEAKATELADQAKEKAELGKKDVTKPTVEGAEKTTELQAKASELYDKYSGDLSQLSGGVDSLKGAMTGGLSSMIPAGVKDTYSELSGSVGELTELISGLSDFKGASLDTIVPQIESKFSEATGLYNKLSGMLPDNLSLDALKF